MVEESHVEHNDGLTDGVEQVLPTTQQVVNQRVPRLVDQGVSEMFSRIFCLSAVFGIFSLPFSVIKPIIISKLLLFQLCLGTTSS